MLNDWYHHRGQLSVYFRLLDVPGPAIYARSADCSRFVLGYRWPVSLFWIYENRILRLPERASGWHCLSSKEAESGRPRLTLLLVDPLWL
jgi:hypothetical protein